MAAFDFPPNAENPFPPQVGDIFQPPGSDVIYVWDGTVWNASVGQAGVGITLITGGDGIDTSPVNGITETGSVSVDSTVVRTTGNQDIDGNKTFQLASGNYFGGTVTFTTQTKGNGTQLGSITALNDTKLTFATTDAALGAQLVTPADQYVEVVSGATAYARFNAADTSLRIGGTLTGTNSSNIELNADGSGYMSKLGLGVQKAPTWPLDIYSNSTSGLLRLIHPTDFTALRIQYGDNTQGVIQFGTSDGIANADYHTFGFREDLDEFVFGKVTDVDSNDLPTTSFLFTINDSGANVVSTGDNTTNTISLNRDGTASFIGSVSVGNYNNTVASAAGISLSSAGGLALKRSAGAATEKAFNIRFGTDETSLITNEGAASFDKSVTIGTTNKGTISATNLSTTRAYELPNANGTIALTSDITGGAIEFVGNVDITGTAPTTPKGGVWVNDTAGNADSSFTGLNQQYIALNQLVFLTDNNGWVAGGVSDPNTYVTISTDQTISGTKSFSSTITATGAITSGGNPEAPTIESGCKLTAYGKIVAANDNTNRVFSGNDSSNGGAGETSLIRGDGSGSVADGNFTWTKTGDAVLAGSLQSASLTDGTTTKTMTEVLNPSGVPTGSVFYFAAPTAPTGYLYCDGTAVSRTTYADLFAICSTTYGAGDGSSTFNLPDLRGQFLRGWTGDSGTIDSGRAFGTNQDSDVNPGDITVNDPGHFHNTSKPMKSGNWRGTSDSGYTADYGTLQDPFVLSATTGITIEATGAGEETRPVNVALLPCIKT